MALPAHAAVKVDLNVADDRKDGMSRGWENWAVTNGATAARVFGDVSVTVRGVGGALRTEVWRPGIAAGATLSADGVTVRGEGRVAVELEFNGLAAGRHSLATWHHWPVDKGVPGAVAIAVDGQVLVRGVKLAAGVTNDFEATSAFVEFTAAAGKPVVVRVEGDGAAVVNGFELGGANPALRASRPGPENFDGHADVREPLMWQAGRGAVGHLVFL
ncbi:MAG: hypothetical protein ABMA26_25895, partial [Limisphaerales bacterium]